MLVLSRKADQKIQIGPNITITILKVKGMAVRIGIEARATCRCCAAKLPSAYWQKQCWRPTAAARSSLPAA